MIFKVSDLKQFIYCPRIIYFTYVMPVEKKTTFKMAYGKEAHIRVDDFEERRKFKLYGLEDGERKFHLNLYSERLGLKGLLDMLIISKGEYYPVEFKDSVQEPLSNHKYQLTAYALLVEDEFKKPVRSGFIHLIPSKKIFRIEITQNMRDYVKKMLSRIKTIIENELMPGHSRILSRCIDCEFKNWCGDI